MKSKSKPEEGALLYPRRVGWETSIEQNGRQYYTCITEGNETSNLLPGYRCRSGCKFSDIEEAPSNAITSLYKRLNPNSNTNFSGPLVLGWDNKEILEASLKDIDFQPFAIKFDKFLIYIIDIGMGEESDFGVKIDYTSSFIGEYNRTRALFIQTVEYDHCKISIYVDNIESPVFFFGFTPSEVWENTKIYKKFTGMQLFGFEHPMTKQNIQIGKIPKCTPISWNNEKIMDAIFNYNLKKRIPNIDWRRVFQSWLDQKSTIIELHGKLKNLYPYNHEFSEREMRAWRAMLRATRCTEITPVSIDKLEHEFWSRSFDPSVDQDTLEVLNSNGFLNVKKKIDFTIADIFWECFNKSLEQNKTGYDGKIRILSIIAKRISIRRTSKKTQEAKRQFEIFFADKNIVNLSSYRVNEKTGDPVKYLKDQKETLWRKYFELHPSGMKRTSFLKRLNDGSFVYKEDMGGLCGICFEYGYGVFDDVKILISGRINEKDHQNQLIAELESIQRHLKCEYEKELEVDCLGNTYHVECLEHCLPYAFGQYANPHISNCNQCNKISKWFHQLMQVMPNDLEQIINNRNKLQYY
ncbi:13749_t:CDS:2, partial [Entrophospora sp. SA101]